MRRLCNDNDGDGDAADEVEDDDKAWSFRRIGSGGSRGSRCVLAHLAEVEQQRRVSWATKTVDRGSTRRWHAPPVITAASGPAGNRTIAHTIVQSHVSAIGAQLGLWLSVIHLIGFQQSNPVW